MGNFNSAVPQQNSPALNAPRKPTPKPTPGAAPGAIDSEKRPSASSKDSFAKASGPANLPKGIDQSVQTSGTSPLSDPFAAQEASELDKEFEELLKPFYEYFDKNAPELSTMLDEALKKPTKMEADEILDKIYSHSLIKDNLSLNKSLRKIVVRKFAKQPLSKTDIDWSWYKVSETGEKKRAHEDSREASAVENFRADPAELDAMIAEVKSKSDHEKRMQMIRDKYPEIADLLDQLGGNDLNKNIEIVSKIINNPGFDDEMFGTMIFSIMQEKAANFVNTNQNTGAALDKEKAQKESVLDFKEKRIKLQQAFLKLASEKVKSMYELDQTMAAKFGMQIGDANINQVVAINEKISDELNKELKAEVQTLEKSLEEKQKNFSSWEKMIDGFKDPKVKLGITSFYEDNKKQIQLDATGKLLAHLMEKALRESKGTITEEELINLTNQAINETYPEAGEEYRKEMLKLASSLIKESAGKYKKEALRKTRQEFIINIAKAYEDDKTIDKLTENYKKQASGLYGTANPKAIEEDVKEIKKVIKETAEIFRRKIADAKTLEERKLIIDQYRKDTFGNQEPGLMSKVFDEILENYNRLNPINKSTTETSPDPAKEKPKVVQVSFLEPKKSRRDLVWDEAVKKSGGVKMVS